MENNQQDNYSTSFQDVSYMKDPKNLIGKLVLLERGSSITGTSKSIKKIVSINKVTFKIEDSDSLYSLLNGYAKLQGSVKQSMSIIDQCKLISIERAEQLHKLWAENREKKEIFYTIKKLISETTIDKIIRKYSKESLEKIQKILIDENLQK